jgi:Flp pilus assembly pilin Flp
MKTNNHTLRSALTHLIRSEQGAEGLEKILIVAAIVLPFLGVLILLRDRISSWLGTSWETSTQDANLTNPTINAP